MDLDRVRLYIITDRSLAGGAGRLLDQVAGALAGVPPGAAAVQLRERDLGPRALVELTRALVVVTRARACPLLVNERLDVALAAGADGVHLPERGMDIEDARAVAGPSALIGVSTHDPARAAHAAARGADLIVLGPIHPTPSKAGMGQPLGPGVLSRARAAAGGAFDRARLLALGGVTSPERARACALAGAAGVAGIRAFMSAADPARAAADLCRAVDSGVDSVSGTLRSPFELG